MATRRGHDYGRPGILVIDALMPDVLENIELLEKEAAKGANELVRAGLRRNRGATAMAVVVHGYEMTYADAGGLLEISRSRANQLSDLGVRTMQQVGADRVYLKRRRIRLGDPGGFEWRHISER